MDQSLLFVLALVLAVIVVMGSVAWIITRPRTQARAGAGPASDPDESPIAVATEGMKICPKCGMGNFWAERRCGACGNGLRG